MDIASFIGIFGGIAVVIFGGYTGGSLGGLFHVPSLFITLGGSYMCLYVSFPLHYVVGVFKVIARIFRKIDYHEKELVQKNKLLHPKT